jgi:hypothetical protein
MAAGSDASSMSARIPFRAAFICAAVLRAQPEANHAPAVPEGSVCIAAVPPPDAKSLEMHPGSAKTVYTIKFDELSPIRTRWDQAVAAPPLSLALKHTVQIFGDGKRVASFYFRFGEFATNSLCLAFDDFYEQWHLLDCERARAWRLCQASYKLSWVEVKTCQVVAARVVPTNHQYYTDYQIKYVAEGREFLRYMGSGLPPVAQTPSTKAALPAECRYNIRYHPGMPEKAEVSWR